MTKAEIKKELEKLRKAINSGKGDRIKNIVKFNSLKKALREEVPATSTASIPNPADTAMGPRIKTTSVTDRRRKKDQVPVLLKRFRKYMENDA